MLCKGHSNGAFSSRRRALVILRDGLTADSTRRTIPELKRVGQVPYLTDPDHHQALTRPGKWLKSI